MQSQLLRDHLVSLIKDPSRRGRSLFDAIRAEPGCLEDAGKYTRKARAWNSILHYSLSSNDLAEIGRDLCYTCS